MFKLRKIKQGDPTGCGLSCIAMLANTNYKKVKDIAIKELGFDDSRKFYTDTKDLRDLGNHFNIKIGKRRRPFKSFDALPDTAILAINYKEKLDEWHWVVYRRTSNDEFVYDPNKNIKSNRRRDFGRIKTKWFLPVINI